MITLNNFTKLDNNQYQMVLSMKKTDSVEELPSETRPMSPEYFAVTVDYGVPADGSIVIKEGGEILAYSTGEWEKAGTAGDIKLKELFVKENGKYLPESGYVGFNKVVVDVKPKVVMPVKGDLITLDGKQYRVLKTNDTVAEVLAMYDATDKQEFGSNNVYANSSLDTYLSNTFYESLSIPIQHAIVDRTFTQDSWEGGTGWDADPNNYSGVYNPSERYVIKAINSTYGVKISRKFYVLSLEDVVNYLDAKTSMDFSNTTLTFENIWKMFWNQTTSPDSENLWLRSAYSESANHSFCVDSELGFTNISLTSRAYTVRPAFQIDLSKVDWTKSE